MTIKFNVSPEAEVCRLAQDGSFPGIGWSSEPHQLGLNPGEVTGKVTHAKFKFEVPLWSDKRFVSEEYSVAWNDLKGPRAYPTDGGTLRLKMSLFERFQATFTPPQAAVLALLGLLGTGLLAYLTHKAARRLQLVPRGTTYGDYRILEKIGQGGMGVVYAAESSDGLKVAIKSILPVLADEEDFRKRFEREIKVCTRLSHPNLLVYEGFGIDSNGGLFSVTELLVGQTLKQVLSSGQYQPPELALRVVEQIGSALSYLHTQGLLHRDIKPDNIFVCSDGHLKLMDMGLLRGDELTLLTPTGHVLGTPAYFAPEQALDKAEEVSDQYSLGIVLYEILTGLRPFRQPKAEMLAFQHATVAPEPLSSLEPRVPGELEDAILRMLAKKPGDRFATMKDARDALVERLQNLDWSEDEGLDTINTPLT